MMKHTVPWLPWLRDEMPSGVVWFLRVIERIAWEATQCSPPITIEVGERAVVEGTSLVEIVQARTEVGIEEAAWYIELAIELGLLGAASMSTGERVTIEREARPMDEA